MRDYIKVATVIWHDEALEPGAPRFGAYFDSVEEAQNYFTIIQTFTPQAKADLMDFRWFGQDKGSFIVVMNSAYFQAFNYQLFIDGYDGESLGKGLAIFVESPRKDGFNSLTEEPKSKR